MGVIVSLSIVGFKLKPYARIHKAKSNFTVFNTAYIYTRSDFKQMGHFHEFETLAKT